MSNELQTKLDAILADKKLNLLPRNLRKGVKFLGVDGELNPDIDAIDATAIPDDLLDGKVAYNNNGRMIGSMEANKIPAGNLEKVNQATFIHTVDTICDVDFEQKLYIYRSAGSKNMYIGRIKDNSLSSDIIATISGTSMYDAMFCNRRTDDYVDFVIKTFSTVTYYRLYLIDNTVTEINTITDIVGTTDAWDCSMMLKNSLNEFVVFSTSTIYLLAIVDDTLVLRASTSHGKSLRIRNWFMRGARFLDDGTIYFSAYTFKYNRDTNTITNTSSTHPDIRFMWDDGTWLKMQDSKAYLMSTGNTIIADITDMFDGVTCDGNADSFYNIYGNLGYVARSDIYATNRLSVLQKQPDNTFITLDLQLSDCYSIINSNNTIAICTNICHNLKPAEEEILSIDMHGTTYYRNRNANISAEHILVDKQIYNDGKILTGTMPNNGKLNYKANKDDDIIIPMGYTSGGKVSKVTHTVDENIVPSNILYGIRILDVSGDADVHNILMGRIANGATTNNNEKTTESTSVNAQIGSYVYAFVYHRKDITSFTDGWTLYSHVKPSSSVDAQVSIFYKIAELEVEPFSVEVSATSRLGIIELSTYDCHELFTKVYETVNAVGEIPFIQKGDIIVCGSQYSQTNITNVFDINLDYVRYDCPDTQTRFTVFIANETKTNAVVTMLGTIDGTTVCVYRNAFLDGTNLLPENIKKGVTIFGVTGTMEDGGGLDE